MDKKYYVRDSLLKAIYSGKGVEFFDMVDKDTRLVESPNNVRALVLSPEGFSLFQWTDNDLNRPTANKIFPEGSEGVRLSFESDNYLEVLTKPRVCSHIEEIVVVASTGGAELAIEAKSLFGLFNLYSELGRLRAIRIVKSYPRGFSEFVGELREGMSRSSEKFASLSEVVDGMGYDTVKVYTNDDFYKTPVALRPKYYQLDEKGGLLSKRLAERQKEIEGLISASKVSKVSETGEASETELKDDFSNTKEQSYKLTEAELKGASVGIARYIKLGKLIIAMMESRGYRVDKGEGLRLLGIDSMSVANYGNDYCVDSKVLKGYMFDSDLALKMLRLGLVGVGTNVALTEDIYNHVLNGMYAKACVEFFGRDLDVLALHKFLVGLNNFRFSADEFDFNEAYEQLMLCCKEGYSGIVKGWEDMPDVEEFSDYKDNLLRDVERKYVKLVSDLEWVRGYGTDEESANKLGLLGILLLSTVRGQAYGSEGLDVMSRELARVLDDGEYAKRRLSELKAGVVSSALSKEQEELLSELDRLRDKFKAENERYFTFSEAYVEKCLTTLKKRVEGSFFDVEGLRKELALGIGAILRKLYDGSREERGYLGIRVSAIRLGNDGRKSVSLYGSGLTMQELKSVCMVVVSVNLLDRRYNESADYVEFLEKFFGREFNSPRDILGDEVMDEIIGVRKEDREKFRRGELR